MKEIMEMPEGLIPVIRTCIDEDYFLDVRRATTHVLYQFLRHFGTILTGNFSPFMCHQEENHLDCNISY